MSELKTFVKLQGDDLITGSWQDCEPYMEFAKAAHNEGRHGEADFKHAAKLPHVLVEKYCNTNGITFAEFMKGSEHIKRMCNDPALSAFRIWPGRL